MGGGQYVGLRFNVERSVADAGSVDESLLERQCASDIAEPESSPAKSPTPAVASGGEERPLMLRVGPGLRGFGRGRGRLTSLEGEAAGMGGGQRLNLEQPVGIAEAASASGDGGTSTIIEEERDCGSGVADISEFQDDHFTTSTPTQSRTIINESLTIPPIGPQLHNVSLPAVDDAASCQGCKALRIQMVDMETNIAKLTVRIDQLSQQKNSKSFSNRSSNEIFTDKRLMGIKAAAFVTGRPLSAHMCKQLVFDLYDNEPPTSFTTDDIKRINDYRECRDAQSLSKWAVFEMFSLQELVGRNCLGGGHDSSSGDRVEIKKPFDEVKMRMIKTSVLNLYPQQNDSLRKTVWMKCVEKINTDVRYLFKVSFKKHEWLQLGF